MPKKTVAERVAEKFIKLLEEGNLPPWKKGWTQGEANEFWPKNAISNKVYRGPIYGFLTLKSQLVDMKIIDG